MKTSSSGSSIASPGVTGVAMETHSENGSSSVRSAPWRVVAETLKGSVLVNPEQGAFIRDVLERAGNSLKPVFVAEVLVYIGTTISSGEQVETACSIVAEAVEASTKVNWRSVFLSISQMDKNLKIRTFGCLAFLVEFHRQVYPKERFPTEIVFNRRWTNLYNQALMIRWIVSGGNSGTPTASYLPYQRESLQVYIRDLDVPADEQLLSGFPPELVGPPGNRMWSNEQLLTTLLDLASEGSHNEPGVEKDPDEVEAARIAYEILRRPTVNCPALLLATIVNSASIPPAPGRLFSMEVLGMFWKGVQQHQLPSDPIAFFRWLAMLNPSRFVSSILGATYSRHPDKLTEVTIALKSDKQLLLDALDGPPAPFRFHLLHAAWSPDFNSGIWLRERLKNDPSGEVAKEFLLFLILTLCPTEVLQQRLPPHAKHPMRRLTISRQELAFYLASILGTCKDPNVVSGLTFQLDTNWDTLCKKSPDTLEAELFQMKQACSKLLPQLASFIKLIRPTVPDVGGVTPVGLYPDHAAAAPALKAPGALILEEQQQQQVSMNVGTSATTDPTPTIAGPPPPTAGGATAPSSESALEQEVHRYFAMLYTGGMSCDTLVELMKKLSSCPPKSQEYQIFNHMVKLLFHECRFFPKYPLTELAVTAQLMGKMIRHEILVGHGPHGTAHMLAIRCVLEALRKGDTTKMFRFGVTALEQFVGPRMVSSPDFLGAFVTLPDVRRHFPSYVAYAEQCLATLPPEIARLRYIDSTVLMTLQLPPPPAPCVSSPFSLTPYCSADIEASASSATAPLQREGTQGGIAWDGLACQRRLVLNGQLVSLAGFGLGTVEQLLSSEPSLRTVEPPPWFVDQVAQIFNSLVASNLDMKVEDLRSILQPEWQGYLALYIVKSRASKETNLHQLYVTFIERLGLPKLFDMVVATTYDCINVLLSYCDDARESSSYRTVLKNLGAWLGTITLARNCPLRGKSIDIKNFLFDGYENGRLKVLLPLCCKILEGVGRSRNFRPPNPWSVGIFNLLAEIHALPRLATPLVFEIEVLFKNLGLSVSDFAGRTNHLAKRAPPPADSPDFTARPAVSPTTAGEPPRPMPGDFNIPAPGFQPRPRPPAGLTFAPGFHGGASSSATPAAPHKPLLTAAQLQQAGVSAAVAATQAAVTAANPPPSAPTHSPLPSTATPAADGLPADFQAVAKAALANDSSLVRTFGPANIAGRHMTPPITATPSSGVAAASEAAPQGTLLAGLMKSAVISPSLALFQLKPALKAVVPHAMERAIKEIVQVVSERSVSISCVTTREIVLKDFASEINDSLVRRAAHLMAASLAGSLALVTCREPLRAALCQHLRSLLLSASDKLGEDQRLVDQVVIVATADNIELGCSLVEEAVIQKALQDVEENIASALAARRQAKAMGNQRFQDPAYFNTGSRWPMSLPPLLQPSTTLSGQQLQVYKDFLLFGSLRRMQASNGSGVQQPRPPPMALPGQESAALSAGPTGVVAGVTTPAKLETDSDGNLREADAGLGTNLVELQACLIKVEEHLARLKELVQEIAFCSPILPYKMSPETRYATPMGATADFAENLPAVNSSLLTLSRLPSDHELFSVLVAIPTICALCKEQEAAFPSVAQRILKMIADAAALHREPLVVLRGSDVAGLYVEACFGALACVMKAEQFPQAQFSADLAVWLTALLEDRRLGADVAINLVRYNLLSFAKLDHVLVEQSMSSVERKDVAVFENLARILYRVATETGIRVPDLPNALSALKGSRELLSRLPVSTAADTETLGTGASLSALFGRSVITLDGLPACLFGEARNIVMERINDAFNRTSPPASFQTPVISTVTELLDNYATFGGLVVSVRRFPVPPEIPEPRKELIASLFHQWMLCSLVVGSEKRSKVWAEYFQSLSKQRLLQMDQETDAFLCGCIDRAIEVAMATPETAQSEKEASASSEEITVDTLPQVESEVPNLKPLDAFAKMIVAMMRLIDPAQISPVLILQRALAVLVRCIHRDAESPDGLNQNVYYRLLLSLIWEVVQPNRGLDQQLVSSLLSFSNAYQALNPCVVPAFAFCWLELISHRCFLPKMLKHYREWPYFQRLLSSLFRFLYPFLYRAHLTSGVRVLYRGTLRLLLVLLHDFPEFLCDHHIAFCDNLPLNGVQLRNLILSAFPRDMKLPDPFTPNLKVDLLPESRRPPRLAGHLPALLVKHGIKKHLDDYWRTRDTEHLDKIIPKLRFSDKKTIARLGVHYDVSLINALLLQVAAQLPSDKTAFSTNGSGAAAPAVRVALLLTEKLDAEGRYVVISSISNHLRYPNMHTHYFSCLLLWLFGASAHNEMVQEQITRVLLERLVAHRPHPWGLLITFIELIKNPRFNFWNCSFVHSVPEVQRLFQSVAQTCFGQRNTIQQQQDEQPKTRQEPIVSQ